MALLDQCVRDAAKQNILDLKLGINHHYMALYFMIINYSSMPFSDALLLLQSAERFTNSKRNLEELIISIVSTTDDIQRVLKMMLYKILIK